MFERDAAKADRAIWRLIGCPENSLPYLKKKLRPAPVPDAARVRSLLAKLDSADFRTRISANEELAKLGELIRTQIDQALKDTDKPEPRRRLEALAENARASALPFGSMTRIGEWRSLEILEKIGSPQAIQILRDLANGLPIANLQSRPRRH